MSLALCQTLDIAFTPLYTDTVSCQWLNSRKHYRMWFCSLARLSGRLNVSLLLFLLFLLLLVVLTSPSTQGNWGWELVLCLELNILILFTLDQSILMTECLGHNLTSQPQFTKRIASTYSMWILNAILYQRHQNVAMQSLLARDLVAAS